MITFDPRMIHSAIQFAQKVEGAEFNLTPNDSEVGLRISNAETERAEGWDCAIISAYVDGKRVRILITGEPGTRAAMGL